MFSVRYKPNFAYYLDEIQASLNPVIPVSVHRTGVISFKCKISLKSLRPGH